MDGRLYGRGSTDDNGPVLCWLHVIDGYQALGIPLPVNLKFVFEGMDRPLPTLDWENYGHYSQSEIMDNYVQYIVQIL